MNIKMIVTDLDRTLLRTDKTVSEYTADIFRHCREAGIITVFATGRPVRAVAKWLKIDVHCDACIYHNGAVIKVGGKLLNEVGIEYDTVNRLLAKAEELRYMRVAVEINDSLYANFDASFVWSGVEFNALDISALPKHSADKMIFVTSDKIEISRIEKLFDDSLYGQISENEIYMVMNKNARKSNAVRETAEYHGISMSEVAAFGDDHNDVEMLRECGIGIAVENAIPEAKVAADFVCADCDSDGVAKWLEEHVLLKAAAL